MPICGIKQPDVLEVNNEIRLKAYDGKYEFAYEWYQDVESLELIDGKGKGVSYTYERLGCMYEYLNKQGELYFIEIKDDNVHIPVGAVILSELDMCIVISSNHRNKGIGNKVIQCLINRAKVIGYSKIYVKEIYSFNTASQKLFEGNGFIKQDITADGASYFLDLEC